jgi:hypothetical protein
LGSSFYTGSILAVGISIAMGALIGAITLSKDRRDEATFDSGLVYSLLRGYGIII